MHITSGACGAGEMLDPALQGLAQDAGDADYFALEHAVPESSHTVEIEYVFEHEPPPDEPQRAPGAAPPAKRSRRPVKRAADDESEPELTNLTWLQNITNIMQVPQFPLAPVSPGPPRAPPPQNTRLHKFNQTLAKCQQDFAEHRAEYRADRDKKPPYSYSTLICMAMRCNNDKMTLSAIYSWIRDNFKYYRNADPTWQNSIRHNLSLNKVFVKVARSKHEPGKGGFWKLELGHLEGGQRISNRPHKKKRARGARQHEPSGEPSSEPSSEPSDEAREVASAVDALPELGLEALEAAALGVAANVIVEPAEPPPLLAEDDLSALLLAAPDWEDLQLDCIDNYLDTCFK